MATCGLSLVAVSGDCSLVAVPRFLTVLTSLVAEHRLSGEQALVVAARGLRCCAPRL